MKTVKLEEIVRQKDPELRQVVEQIARGEVREAIQNLDRQGRVHEIRGHDERIAAIAKEYAKSPENTLVISPDNRSRMEINERVHAELQRSGLVSNEEHRIRTLVPRQNLTGADRTCVDGKALEAQNVAFDVSIILAGELKGRNMRMFQVYSAGNFIEATPDTPFLQVCEHKYGKPILDRVVEYGTDLMDGVKVALVSMDSTLRSNLTVGMPIDLLVYRRAALAPELKRRITEDDAYFLMIRERWSEALRNAYRAIPRPSWRD